MINPTSIIAPRWQMIVVANSIKDPWLRAQALWNIGIQGSKTKKEIDQIANIERLRARAARSDNIPQLPIVHNCS